MPPREEQIDATPYAESPIGKTPLKKKEAKTPATKKKTAVFLKEAPSTPGPNNSRYGMVTRSAKKKIPFDG